ncbi:hypothetical protein [Agrobacterium sp. OT33]|uniref:hypothetical protein n=1 Tax=Agrobacterium sp. OT33 TaxID=2815338 RepID=UPI001A8C8676|nr:hypothetical protein [Agrobacterium sp. OT33]MBO0125229.1 hypothetical protein [Agrobacterium sp. OT33]
MKFEIECVSRSPVTVPDGMTLLLEGEQTFIEIETLEELMLIVEDAGVNGVILYRDRISIYDDYNE